MPIENNSPITDKEKITRDFFDSVSDASQWSELSNMEYALIRRVFRDLELGPGDRVVEPGCGTGRLTVELSEAVGKSGWVFSFDLSAKMIERARTRRHFSNVHYSVGSVTDIPLFDSSMDVAICYNCFHLFACPPRSVGEIARVLAPGGRLAIVQSENLNDLYDERYLPDQLKSHNIPSLSDILTIFQAFGLHITKIPRTDVGFVALAVKSDVFRGYYIIVLKINYTIPFHYSVYLRIR